MGGNDFLTFCFLEAEEGVWLNSCFLFRGFISPSDSEEAWGDYTDRQIQRVGSN